MAILLLVSLALVVGILDPQGGRNLVFIIVKQKVFFSLFHLPRVQGLNPLEKTDASFTLIRSSITCHYIKIISVKNVIMSVL